MDVSLIIPAHNEQHRLVATLDRYLLVLKEYTSEYEVLVVANGCTDQTVAVARRFAAARPRITVVDIPEQVGKGGAVLIGFQRAVGVRIAFVDADGSTAPASLIELLDDLDTHDVVIGSRRLAASSITQRQPLQRRILGWGFLVVVRALFRMPYSDTQCGAKAFRLSAARELARTVREQRWAFDVDLLLSANLLGLIVAEHPVIWADSAGSRLHIIPTLCEVIPAFWLLNRRYAGATIAQHTFTTMDGLIDGVQPHESDNLSTTITDFHQTAYAALSVRPCPSRANYRESEAI